MGYWNECDGGKPTSSRVVQAGKHLVTCVLGSGTEVSEKSQLGGFFSLVRDVVELNKQS